VVNIDNNLIGNRSTFIILYIELYKMSATPYQSMFVSASAVN
jgi:hypothetical protein